MSRVKEYTDQSAIPAPSDRRAHVHARQHLPREKLERTKKVAKTPKNYQSFGRVFGRKKRILGQILVSSKLFFGKILVLMLCSKDQILRL
jgi:hypothetical protein